LDVRSTQVGPYLATIFVSGIIVYNICRALFFEFTLNRLRDYWWSHGSLEANTESHALLARFSNEELAQFLDLRFGWCNAQIQTSALLPLSLLIGAPGSLWHKCSWVILLLSVVLFGSTVIQLRTLWRIEKTLVNPARPSKKGVKLRRLTRKEGLCLLAGLLHHATHV